MFPSFKAILISSSTKKYITEHSAKTIVAQQINSVNTILKKQRQTNCEYLWLDLLCGYVIIIVTNNYWEALI